MGKQMDTDYQSDVYIFISISFTSGGSRPVARLRVSSFFLVFLSHFVIFCGFTIFSCSLPGTWHFSCARSLRQRVWRYCLPLRSADCALQAHTTAWSENPDLQRTEKEMKGMQGRHFAENKEEKIQTFSPLSGNGECDVTVTAGLYSQHLPPPQKAGETAPEQSCRSGWSPRVLKACADQLCGILQHLFNFSLSLEKVQWLWKTSCLVPMPNKSPSALNDYRPVALTSHIMKVLERLVLAHLRPQVTNFIDPMQFA